MLKTHGVQLLVYFFLWSVAKSNRRMFCDGPIKSVHSKLTSILKYSTCLRDQIEKFRKFHSFAKTLEGSPEWWKVAERTKLEMWMTYLQHKLFLNHGYTNYSDDAPTPHIVVLTKKSIAIGLPLSENEPKWLRALTR